MEEYKRARDTSSNNISARYQLARMYIQLKYFDVFLWRVCLRIACGEGIDDFKGCESR
jgi:hypothetical protein